MRRKLYLYVKAFSDLGSFMDSIVINAMILSLTGGSAAWLAAALAAGTLGGVFSSLYSGIVADRMDRRKLMIATDILRALLVLMLIPFPTPMMILVSRFLNGLLGPFFGVSFSAEVPNMFGESKALETNALISRLGSLCMLAGFFGGGYLSDKFGYSLVLGLDAFSYIVSALALVFLRWERQPARQAATAEKKGIWRGIADDLGEVTRYLRLHPVLLMVSLLLLVDTFGASSHNLGFPLLAGNLSPSDSTFTYGLLWGVWGIGNVLTSLILPRLSFVRRQMHLTFFVTTLLMSTGFVSTFSAGTLPLTLVCCFLTGIFDAFAVTLNSTIMQQTDNHIRGRVFGVQSLVNRFGFGTGFLVAPLILGAIGLTHMVYVMHGLILLTTSVILIAYVILKKKGVFNDGQPSQTVSRSL